MDGRLQYNEPAELWSGSRHQAILASLQNVEKKLVSVLRTAATAMNHIVPRRSGEDSIPIAFSTTSTEFLQLIKEVHEEISGHLHLVSDYRMFGRSAYGPEKDMEISVEKVDIIVAQLRQISKYIESGYTQRTADVEQ